MNDLQKFAVLFIAGLVILAVITLSAFAGAVPTSLYDGRYYITDSSADQGWVPYTANRTLGADADIVDVGHIYQHGSGTDTGMGTNGIATTNAVGWSSRVFACAVQYLEEDGIDFWKGSRNLTGCVFWQDNFWGIGGTSDSTATNPRDCRVTAWQIQDSLLIDMAEAYPNLRKIVVFGHSAGAMMQQKLAILDWADSTLATDYGIELVYIVGEAGTLVHLSTDRVALPSIHNFEFPDTAGVGTTFDNLPRYGLSNCEALTGRTRTAIQDHYETQHVLYVCGSDDTTGVTDTSDESVLMGTWRWRYGRNLIYWNSLRHVYGAFPPNQTLHMIEGIGHENAGLYADPVVRYWLYDYLMDDGPIVDDSYDNALDWQDINDFADFSGLDANRIRALWIPRADSVQTFSRTAAVAAGAEPVLAAGAFAPRGGPFGNDAFAYQFDGGAPANAFTMTNATGSDSTELLDQTMILAVYQTGSAADQMLLQTGNISWPMFIDGAQWRPRVLGEYLSFGAAGDYDDYRYHVFGVALFSTPDSALVWVDNRVPVAYPRAAGTNMVDAAYATIIGSRANGTYGANGRLALLLIYHLKSSVPYTVEYSVLWSRLHNYLGLGIGPFVTPQAAADYARSSLDGDGVIDTVHVRPGTYYQPVRVQVDSTAVAGAEPATVILDGSLVPGENLVGYLAGAVTVRNLTLRNSTTAAVAAYGTFTGSRLENTLIYDCATAVSSIIFGGTNTFVVDNCTVVDCGYGINVPGTNQGINNFTDNIVTGATSVGAWRQAGQLRVLNSLFYDNADDTTATQVNTGLIFADPLYVDALTRDYRIYDDSPGAQVGVALSGDWLGALGVYTTGGGTPPGGLPPGVNRFGNRKSDPWGGTRPFGRDPWSTGPWGR